jgi:5-methylcytosine-specific restriction protein A
MAWEGSTRKARLPRNWQALRKQVMERDDYRCTATLRDGSRCAEAGSEVDHIEAMADVHTLDALQLLCSWHHAKKSSREGNAARLRPPPLRRPSEAHPGLR